MNASTNTTSLAKPSALPDSWIEKLFSRFSAMYGRKFADLWSGCNLKEVKAAWAEDLAVFSGEEIKYGLAACKTRTFPPTLPEFILLCRPAIDYEALYIGAANALNDGRWKSKLAYWATRSVGMFEVRNEPYKRMEARWKNAVDELLSDGELPEIPPRQEALPKPGQNSIGKEEAARRVKELGINPTSQKDPKDWARKILESPAVYPAISIAFAKKALEATE